MSLANEILYGDVRSVQAQLQMGADPNEIDEYGFTPLIEAAIVNKVDVSELLIKMGADPNMPDFAGRTPLHWAVENQNDALATLLLENKADPNCHTNTAEPALAIPVLRGQEKIKNLLYKYGGDINFAKDYINGKLLGHRFELLGHAYMSTPKKQFIVLDLEGFFLEFSLSIIKDSLLRFRKNYAARRLTYLFPHIDKIISALDIAAELIRYQQYTIDLTEHEDRINQLLSQPLLIIPATYQGHAITFVRYGNIFAKCDRGANSQFEGSVVIYRITQPENLTTGLLRQIVYKKQKDEFMHSGINERLGLERVMNLPVGPQITGNCSWANVEAAIPTMLFMSLLTDKNYKSEVKRAMRDAINFYEQWREWDKDRALDECIQSFTDSDEVRQASKAIILAAVLFQTCEYTDIKNIQRAEKILSILSKKEFHPYLENYVKVYYKKKWTEAGENLMHLFDMVAPSR